MALLMESQGVSKRRGRHGPSVVVVDDDPASRRTLELIAQSNGYRTFGFGSAEQLLHHVERIPPGCVVIDLHLPGMSGVELVERLDRWSEPVTTVVVTGSATVTDAVQCMRAGTVDFLVKPVEPTAFGRVLRRAIDLDARRREENTKLAAKRVLFSRLTPRERQVLDLLASGRTSRQIADSLSVSGKTVDVHRANIRRKLNVESLADLVRFSYLTSAGATAAVTGAAARMVRPTG